MATRGGLATPYFFNNYLYFLIFIFLLSGTRGRYLAVG
jgi:hypothetical protein